MKRFKRVLKAFEAKRAALDMGDNDLTETISSTADGQVIAPASKLQEYAESQLVGSCTELQAHTP